jgi:hypothetical protein
MVVIVQCIYFCLLSKTQTYKKQKIYLLVSIVVKHYLLRRCMNKLQDPEMLLERHTCAEENLSPIYASIFMLKFPDINVKAVLTVLL